DQLGAGLAPSIRPCRRSSHTDSIHILQVSVKPARRSGRLAPSGSAPQAGAVAVIGASGALGYGLALRLGIAGIPIVIGSRDAGPAAGSAAELSDHALSTLD